MFGPLSRISPSSPILSSTPGSGLPDRAEAERLRRVDHRRRGGLGHPVALHHRHAAGVEELEDLLGDRRRAGHALADAPAEEAAHVLVELLLGLLERPAELLRHLLAARLELAHLHAEVHGLLELLAVGRGGGRERVDLLEHPRHRREVGRLDLGEVGDDLLRVLLPVGDRAAEVERHELDQDREGVRQRQEQVHGVALGQHALGLHHRGDLAVVAVGQLSSPWAGRWCPTCR